MNTTYEIKKIEDNEWLLRADYYIDDVTISSIKISPALVGDILKAYIFIDGEESLIEFSINDFSVLAIQHYAYIRGIDNIKNNEYILCNNIMQEIKELP